jgi:hypothetical protein
MVIYKSKPQEFTPFHPIKETVKPFKIPTLITTIQSREDKKWRIEFHLLLFVADLISTKLFAKQLFDQSSRIN